MQAMADTARLPDELGEMVKARREALGLTKKELADRSGKVREVIYRLEAGEDVTVSSLFSVLRALGLALRVERAGMPTMEEVRARFDRDEDDAA
jgi:transcriptional regulator with XRE-family HTH domain